MQHFGRSPPLHIRNKIFQLKTSIMKLNNIKSTLVVTLFTFLILTSCKKNRVDVNTCEYEACDSRRKTVAVASNWRGQLGYYNDLRKWAVNYHLPGTYDSTMTCIICTDIPDSLKTIGTTVSVSGEIKEGCGSPSPTFYGQGIFYVNPTKLSK